MPPSPLFPPLTPSRTAPSGASPGSPPVPPSAPFRASASPPPPHASPHALPPASAPPPCGVPAFEPLRVRGGGGRGLRRAVWRQRRALAAGLALTAAALAATGLGGTGAGAGGDTAYGVGAGGAGGASGAVPGQVRRPVARLVSAPVRIADAGAVRLLRPGDRVDVIAAGEGGPGAAVRVLAKGARVADVPRAPTDGAAGDGALVVLSVPRETAASLAGAGISSRLAVALC
ncbi:RcpC/CpaB family pilus assembly protein [Streptomyces sp. NPDC006435]|uniref:RcpC/CpaB family pilus assembly protein n=1 Tax=Streptomyces sp. NPDC006435 TaxID=3154300 RepID=UPI0033BF291D